MKLNYIFLLISILVLSSLFVFKDSVKDILRDYMPFHSKAYVYKLIEERDIYFTKKVTALQAMKDFFEVEKNLTLTSIDESGYFSHEDINLNLFKPNFLNKIKNGKAKGGAYLAQYEDSIIIAQENGLFFFAQLSEFGLDANKIKHVPSNIFSQIKYFDFYGPGQYGMKGLFADEQYIYASVSFMKELNCFNTSILRAELDQSFLNFEIFFVPNDCVNIKNDYGEYNASDSGGRIAEFNDNKILFSTGTFRYRDLAQDLSSELGKILVINKNTAKAEIVSMGHRNVMGLSYKDEAKEIWSTEHGPNGGDEINLNQYGLSKDIKNFGWPISSYGEHYSASKINPEGALIVDTDDKTYQKAPLYKSHDKHGFKEPEIFFVPSIGISAIVANDQDFFNKKGFSIIFSSKGNNFKAENEKTIFLYNPTNKSKLKIFSGERIRDILYIPSTSQIIFSGETNGVIGIISSKI